MKTKTTTMIWIIMDSSGTAYTTGSLGTANDTITYTYGSAYWRDQLTSYNGTTITYDAVGNPLKWRDGMSFTWMAGRQMYTTTMSNGNKYYYEYNDDGIRYKKWKSGGLVTNYYLDGSTIIAEKNSQNTIIYKHDENGRYVGFNLNGTDYYYVYNAQGDVMGIVNASGTIVARYTYDPWGKVLAVRNVAGAIVTSSTHVGNINPIRYRGYYYDAETGLYYLQSRYYDPTVGRFVNADAGLGIGTDMDTYNAYVYCGNNPISRYDNNGMSWIDLIDPLLHSGHMKLISFGIDTAAYGAFFLMMKKDSQGIYHVNYLCWQMLFGYYDLYDVLFDIGTSMESAKFDFTCEGNSYVIWAWKGDYLNFGAGAEMGFYHYFGPLCNASVFHPIQMGMSLSYKNEGFIVYYTPGDPQWWITGFNPNYLNVNASDLTAFFAFKFGEKNMFEAFRDRWSGDPRLKFYERFLTITFKF